MNKLSILSNTIQKFHSNSKNSFFIWMSLILCFCFSLDSSGKQIRNSILARLSDSSDHKGLDANSTLNLQNGETVYLGYLRFSSDLQMLLKLYNDNGIDSYNEIIEKLDILFAKINADATNPYPNNGIKANFYQDGEGHYHVVLAANDFLDASKKMEILQLQIAKTIGSEHGFSTFEEFSDNVQAYKPRLLILYTNTDVSQHVGERLNQVLLSLSATADLFDESGKGKSLQYVELNKDPKSEELSESAKITRECLKRLNIVIN